MSLQVESIIDGRGNAVLPLVHIHRLQIDPIFYVAYSVSEMVNNQQLKVNKNALI